MKTNWLQSALKNFSNDPLLPWRTSQLDAFQKAGFPTRQNELWKYTDLSTLSSTKFEWPKKSIASTDIPEAIEGMSRVVFIDGTYSTEHSNITTQDGLVITTINDAINQGTIDVNFFQEGKTDDALLPFQSLNNALFHSGAFISVAKNTVVSKPIHLLHVQTLKSDSVIQPVKHIILADTSSKVTIFEEYASKSATMYFNNVFTQIKAKTGSHVTHYRLQNEGKAAYHIGQIAIDQSQDSRVDTYHFNRGAELARHDLHYRFAEKGALATIVGLYCGNEKQHLDTHTVVDHIAPHCHSDQIYRGVLSDEAHAVFNGKIHVHQHAQKTQADLNNRNLLLSKKAQVDTKPELEIYADDVKCSHGATVGCIDPASLFYLRSRGIPEANAYQLLVQAFLTEVLESLPDTNIKSYIQSVIMYDLI